MAISQPPILELREASKTYGEGPNQVHALRGVDLAVDAGALVAVMGPSGSGKSTLLAIAGSLEDPSSGEVVVTGGSLSRMSRNAKARLRRRSIGFVLQDFNLLAGLTAVENVALPLELDGTPAAGPVRSGWRLWSVWASTARRSATPTSCRAANASGSPSPARWWASAASSWPTNRPAPWIRPTARP